MFIVKDGQDKFGVQYDYDGIYENIEKRDWQKEAFDYYKNIFKNIDENIELISLETEMRKATSRVGMSFEEYYNEYWPAIFMEYAIFIDELPTDIREYDLKIKQIYSTISPVEHYNHRYLVFIVNKNYKDEYLEKASELLTLRENYFKYEKVSYETYKKESEVLEEWFNTHVFNSGSIEWRPQINDKEDNVGVFWNCVKFPQPSVKGAYYTRPD